MRQDAINLILVVTVALLTAFIVLREPLRDLWQRRANEQQIIKALGDLNERVKKLESK